MSFPAIIWQAKANEKLRNQGDMNNPSDVPRATERGAKGPRSSLKPLGKPTLFGDVIEAVFPSQTRGSDLPYQTSVETSNGRIARLIVNLEGDHGKDDKDRFQSLKIQIGRYRNAKDIPSRAVIKQLAPALGVPPMVLLLYVGRYEEFFDYITAAADLPTFGAGWPKTRPSPLRYAFALGFATFPRLDVEQSQVDRQNVSAVNIFFRGPDQLAHDIDERERSSENPPLVEFLASSTTDGAFLMPNAPARRDIVITPSPDPGEVCVIRAPSEADSVPSGHDCEFSLRAEAQVDASAELSTWIFNNLEPAHLKRGDILLKAVEILNDVNYPVLGRFDLAGSIFEQWAHEHNKVVADEVLSDLWRWNKRQLSEHEAADILRKKSQNATHYDRYLMRKFFGRR